VNNSWGIFIFLGIAALSWVFGKMKEKAEAEEAQKRARLHQQRMQRIAGEVGEDGQSSVARPSPTERISQENPAMQRKEQLAQLRQERLAAMRAEMAARLQKQQQQQQARQTAPSRRQQQSLRPVVAPQPQPQPQPTRRNVATTRKPPSVSHDREPLEDLGTRKAHKPHPSDDESFAHRLVSDASMPSGNRKPSKALPLDSMTAADWRRAIVLSEVLAPPVSLRGPA